MTDLFDSVPSLAWMRPILDSRLIRVEDELAEGSYVIRAELPGLDPDKDIEITVHDGRLTIKAQREERSQGKARSEFSYGSFVRTVDLPQGAREDDVEAHYDKGILTVSLSVGEPESPVHRIPVTNGS
ncbi:Hsp20/alpha crystallin family protein [Haloechinothrix aidingensis]|uniref:Hsp20/alpha crystallin family protein n=1 Tax=Haloechinothrix aidingensis TaxID=2752311 RepID=UPI0031B609BE